MHFVLFFYITELLVLFGLLCSSDCPPPAPPPAPTSPLPGAIDAVSRCAFLPPLGSTNGEPMAHSSIQVTSSSSNKGERTKDVGRDRKMLSALWWTAIPGPTPSGSAILFCSQTKVVHCNLLLCVNFLPVLSKSDNDSACAFCSHLTICCCLPDANKLVWTWHPLWEWYLPAGELSRIEHAWVWYFEKHSTYKQCWD